MLMPLVASLLAPALLAASTYTSVVGTVSYGTNDVSSERVNSSAVIGVPSADAEVEALSLSDPLDVSFDLGFTFVSGHMTGVANFLDYDSDDQFFDFANNAVVDLDCPCLILPLSSYEVNVSLNFDYLWSESLEGWGLYVFVADVDFAYYLPVGSWSYSEGGQSVSFDVDALSSTVDANDVISAVTGGLNVVPHLGGSLNDGFDAVFMNNGALTVAGLFAFTLMGLGIGVGVVKKVLNWITGRHGM